MSEHVEPKPKTMKIPGTDHPISVERNASWVVVTVAGRVVADTLKALTLREVTHSGSAEIDHAGHSGAT